MQKIFNKEISNYVGAITSIAEGCKKLGDILGLGSPVDTSVFISAVKNEEYAHNLLVSRKTKAFLDYFLANPPITDSSEPASEYSDKELLSSAYSSIVKWAKTGFSVASEEVISKRLSACTKCKHLITKKSDSVVYNILKTKARCGLCGCDIDKKIRLNNETCPGTDIENPGYNFWGQKIN